MILLVPYDIGYHTRTLIKDQVLANFLLPKEVFHVEIPRIELSPPTIDEEWTLMVDGFQMSLGQKLGIILISLDLGFIKHALKLEYLTSNNSVKYIVLVDGFMMALELKVSL